VILQAIPITIREMEPLEGSRSNNEFPSQERCGDQRAEDYIITFLAMTFTDIDFLAAKGFNTRIYPGIKV